MTKLTTKELSNLITPDLITYLGDGVLNSQQLAESVDFSGLEIDQFERLKKLHFALYGDVIDYIERLPERLRRIKTQQRQSLERSQGEVRGPINWPNTIQNRQKVGYNDRTLFVVSNPEVEVDIPENRVVKKLLSVINEPLTEDIEPVNQSWRSAWDDADIVRLQQTLAHNVYLDVLPDPAEISLNSRALSTARRSRHELYSEAARLYRLYDDLMNDRFHREGVQDLLRHTIITPTRDFRLFELFSVFGVIRKLREQYPSLELRRIQPGVEEIAVLESENTRISIYYDEGGPLSFFEEYPTAEELDRLNAPKMLIRQAKAAERHDELIQEFLAQGSQHSFFQGRPDFLVLRWDWGSENERLQEAIIGEVKYTDSKSTFSQGLRELLEYIYFARENDEYIFGQVLDTDSVYGIICTDGVDTSVDAVNGLNHWDSDSLKKTFSN